MTQMTQESKSLWRIKNDYIAEAQTEEMKAFWMKLAQEKEAHLAEMKALLKTELK
jgi:hypothetical protein